MHSLKTGKQAVSVSSQEGGNADIAVATNRFAVSKTPRSPWGRELEDGR
jgi:hypothetical protein